MDPCLFIGKTVIVVIYVDDVLLYSKDEAKIDALLKKLQGAGVSIHKEETAEGFLGVDITRESTDKGIRITLLQAGLAK